MVNPVIVQALILVGMGIITAIVLIFFGFLLGRRTQGEATLPTGLFSLDEKPPEEDLFERALLSPEEGGYTDEELDDMARARPYEGMQ